VVELVGEFVGAANDDSVNLRVSHDQGIVIRELLARMPVSGKRRLLG
jgi:hypothetical protein